MKRFLHFDEMITPIFISFIYWIGIVIIILGGLTSTAAMSSFGLGFGQLVLTFVVIVGGIIFWRIFCELMLIIFRIYDKLSIIADNTKK